MAVYFAQAADGAPVKIGSSCDPSQRMRRLRCPVTGAVPRILNVISGGLHCEWWWHARFAHLAIWKESLLGRERRPIFRMTEWFRPSESMLHVVTTVTVGEFAAMQRNWSPAYPVLWMERPAA